MHIRLSWFCLLGVAVALGPADTLTAQVALEFSQPWATGDPFFNLHRSPLADDFFLGAATTLTRARFWTEEEFRTDPFDGFDGTFWWALLENSPSAAPGSLIASGETVAERTNLIPWEDRGEWAGLFENWIDLPDVQLDSGTFWFALKAGPLDSTENNSVNWSPAASTYNTTERIHVLSDGVWTPDAGGPFQGSFELYSGEVVPEPTSLLLLATGLIGIGLSGIRRRRSSDLLERTPQG